MSYVTHYHDHAHFNTEELRLILDQLIAKIKKQDVNVADAKELLKQLQPQINDEVKDLFAEANRLLAPQKTFYADYRPPEFEIPKTSLNIDIYDEYTLVTSKLQIQRKSDVNSLKLDGHNLELIEVKIDGKLLDASSYQTSEEQLIIFQLPKAPEFTLEIVTRIYPKSNKEYEGLYESDGTYLTQCESEGFRAITYFLDRPDIQSIYTVTLSADKSKCPVLLSNGNCIGKADLDEGRHSATYFDPFRKPSYLFALVAGDLAKVEERHTAPSGKETTIQIFCDKGDEAYVSFAMDSLKAAIDWDEDRFGRSYDLDELKLLSTMHYNMGAMENKGLLTFNAKAILADPSFSLDRNYNFVRSVIGHEYFHNWTGNRVTVRDWFQLALKEGLTTFRDQLFSADMGSAAVQRINVIRDLRARQFPEDAGSNSHPILPKSYIQIRNNYTATTYVKGAAFFHMLHLFLGENTFRKGMDLYFDRNDGKAATIYDFFDAINDASERDLNQFKLWIDQAGTPKVKVDLSYDEEKHQATLTLTQSCPPTPSSPEKKPFFIPFSFGFLNEEGAEIMKAITVELKDQKQTFTFHHVSAKPIPSLNRNFLAPIHVEYPYTIDELILLMRHDTDPVNQWDAGQRIVMEELFRLIDGQEVNKKVVEAIQGILHHEDDAFKALMLTLPSIGEVVDQMQVCDFIGADQAIKKLEKAISVAMQDDFRAILEKPQSEIFSTDQQSVGQRALRCKAVQYLSVLDDAVALSTFSKAINITEKFNALKILCAIAKDKETLLNEKVNTLSSHRLALDYWFAAVTLSSDACVYEAMESMWNHSKFDKTCPNHIIALLGTFANQNPIAFHHPSGSGYKFLTDKILEVTKYNGTISGKLANAYQIYPKLPSHLKTKMRAELERIINTPGIASDLYEKVFRLLN
jgi:aminopeptidase N